MGRHKTTFCQFCFHEMVKKRDGTDFRVTGLTCIGSTVAQTGFCIHLEKIAYLLHPFLYLKYNAKTSSLLAQLSIESGNI